MHVVVPGDFAGRLIGKKGTNVQEGNTGSWTGSRGVVECVSMQSEGEPAAVQEVDVMCFAELFHLLWAILAILAKTGDL